MKNPKSTLRLLTVAVASTALAALGSASILNGSFEDGSGADADNWIKFGNAFRENTGARTGDYSMKMFGNFVSGGSTTGAFQDFDINVGESASASVFAQTLSGDQMSGENFALLKLIYRDAADNDLVSMESERITANTTPDQLMELTASLGPAPAGTDHGSIFLLFVQTDADPFAGGSTFFDDVSVNVVPEPASMSALVLLGGLALRKKLKR